VAAAEAEAEAEGGGRRRWLAAETLTAIVVCAPAVGCGRRRRPMAMVCRPDVPLSQIGQRGEVGVDLGERADDREVSSSRSRRDRAPSRVAERQAV